MGENRIYFAKDGNIGQADGMYIIDANLLTEIDWDIIDEAIPENVPLTAYTLYVLRELEKQLAEQNNIRTELNITRRDN